MMHRSIKYNLYFAVTIFVIAVTDCEEEVPGNITDLSLCKLSHLGLEYMGNVATSESGARCQAWLPTRPIHPVPESIKNNDFPDGSKIKARNYCRNPTRDPKGPWCFTMDPNLIDDTCGIPLCSFTECRITGPGSEYGGQYNVGISGRKCLKWNKDRKKVRANGNVTKQEKFDEMKFPDESLSKAKKSCRNPDGDLAGPWCFVEIEDTSEVEKEYCDIPFCDDQECMVFTKSGSIYSHYTAFNDTYDNITFAIKLWDPDSLFNASASLYLTLMALPVYGDEIEPLGIGFEIFLTNNQSGLRYGSKGAPEYEPTIGILKATEYTTFSLSWTNGIVTLQKEGSIKPIFIAEYPIKSNLLGYKKDDFYYYSAQGTNVMWSFPFCDDDYNCDVHTTTTDFFQQYWPLHQTDLGVDVHFYVRAFHSGFLHLVTNPAIDYPFVRILMQLPDNFTRIEACPYKGASTVILKEIALKDILNYWNWHEFSLSIFADTLQMYWTRDMGTHMLFEVKDDVFKKMRWFSPSSGDTNAHWTFFCEPPKYSNPPPAWLPECALNKDESNYEGTQDVTAKGKPCLPWSASKLLPEHKLIGGESLKIWNYCRNPLKTKEGTYCYVFGKNRENRVQKRFCRIRKCKSSECKMAGTGNDYIGTLSKSRTNRTCRVWFDINTNKTPVYVVPEYNNNSLYSDQDIIKAKNYCRNPSRTAAGTWCYTKEVGFDLCDIGDCDKPEECTEYIMSNGKGRYIYILPQWTETGIHGGLYFSAKIWNPDEIDGLAIFIHSASFTPILLMLIGTKNEQIVLQYEGKIVKEKTFPHLIPTGRWVTFWLQIRQGEIMLGYEGVPSPLFEWKHSQPTKTSKPMFLTYTSIRGKTIGMAFKCDECHTENTTTSTYSKILSTTIWTQTEQLIYGSFFLKMRGNGDLIVPIFTMPGFGDYYIAEFKNHGLNLQLIYITAKNETIVFRKRLNKSAYTINTWTTIKFSFNENEVNITSNGTLLMAFYNKNKVVIYYFIVGSENGWITWTANCEPLDIDGPPRDGGWSNWSPWQCTVSCGGGEGYRTRTCSNPHPNIFGEMCKGPTMLSGKCNEFECGDIGPDTIEKIREHLRKTQLSYVVNEMSNVVIKNNPKLWRRVLKESPDAYYEWTFNGMVLKSENDHIIFQGDDIVIRNTQTSDSGVYAVIIYRINGQKLIFHVASLAVIAIHYQISTRVTIPLTIKSNSIILGYVYTDLSQKWMVNNVTIVDHGITTLAAVSSEHFDSLSMNQTGDWKCIVEQKDLGLSWITNYIKIEVKKAPNFYTHLMEDRFTAPLFSKLKNETQVFYAIIFIVIFTIVVVVIGLVVYLKFCTLPKRKYKRNRRK